MKTFNVIIYDFNGKRFVPYDIIPYFLEVYKERKKKLKTFDEFKQFIKKESLYQFWARCQYEIVLTDWPNMKHFSKWDVNKQIEMNLDVITKIFMEALHEKLSS